MIDVKKLSKTYDVRRMEDPDAESILDLCLGNSLYYKYCEAEPTIEQILNDMHIVPPHTALSDKYYVGFFENDTLAAVMDLIDGYPEPEIAYIGFFMMNAAYQGKQIGSSIVSEVAEYLEMIGKRSIMLAIDKGNPQSTHFWKKNGFTVTREVDRNGWTALVAERALDFGDKV